MNEDQNITCRICKHQYTAEELIQEMNSEIDILNRCRTPFVAKDLPHVTKVSQIRFCPRCLEELR